MHNFKRTIAAAFATALLSGAASATPVSTDVTDLWYNPGESGWGLSVYQQQGTVFAVLFVYGTDSQPTWYVASELTLPGNPTSVQFTGPLYRTNGPYFGGPFNPAAVGVRQVGNATFTLETLTTGTFAYSVDGVSVSKFVARQTWGVNNMSGRFVGGLSGTYAGCAAAGGDGTREEPGSVSVSHVGDEASMSVVTAAATCSYNGAHAQSGHYGLLTGSFSCSNGRSGNFSAFGFDAQINGLTGRIDTVSPDGCRYSGRIGGIRGG